MELVPIALACGHLVGGGEFDPADPTGFATFDLPSNGGEPRIECPDGCGPQTFVVEP